MPHDAVLNKLYLYQVSVLFSGKKVGGLHRECMHNNSGTTSMVIHAKDIDPHSVGWVYKTQGWMYKTQ